MSKYRRLVSTWLGARDEIKKARNKREGKPIGVETRLVVSCNSPTREWWSDDCVYAVQYHSSQLVHFYPNGDVGISPNDWNSKTTKQRIGAHSPASLWTSKGVDILAWTRRGAGPVMIIPIDISKEYIIRANGSLLLPHGASIDLGVVRCPQPRTASAKRNRIMHPVPGEVLNSPEGEAYILISPPGGRRGLLQYLGDYDFDTDYIFAGGKFLPMTELFCLTLGEWTSGKRFVRSFVY